LRPILHPQAFGKGLLLQCMPSIDDLQTGSIGIFDMTPTQNLELRDLPFGKQRFWIRNRLLNPFEKRGAVQAYCDVLPAHAESTCVKYTIQMN
jgi:hypothetical protein